MYGAFTQAWNSSTSQCGYETALWWHSLCSYEIWLAAELIEQIPGQCEPADDRSILCKRQFKRYTIVSSKDVRPSLQGGKLWWLGLRVLLPQLRDQWGAIYFGPFWLRFLKFWKERQDIDSIIPHSMSNAWSQSWKRAILELSYASGAVMLYPNFEYEYSFATTYREPGVVRKREWCALYLLLAHVAQHMPTDFGKV